MWNKHEEQANVLDNRKKETKIPMPVAFVFSRSGCKGEYWTSLINYSINPLK